LKTGAACSEKRLWAPTRTCPRRERRRASQTSDRVRENRGRAAHSRRGSLFLQTDPIRYGDGANIYAYVHGDPVNGTDPTGMFDFEDMGFLQDDGSGHVDDGSVDFNTPSSGGDSSAPAPPPPFTFPELELNPTPQWSPTPPQTQADSDFLSQNLTNPADNTQVAANNGPSPSPLPRNHPLANTKAHKGQPQDPEPDWGAPKDGKPAPDPKTPWQTFMNGIQLILQFWNPEFIPVILLPPTVMPCKPGEPCTA